MNLSLDVITDVYKILKTEARAGHTLYYSELADEVRAKDISVLIPALDEISRREVMEGRGMLSVLVVGKLTGRPGKGFFELASQLYNQQISNKNQFFEEEIRKVHNQWRATKSKPARNMLPADSWSHKPVAIVADEHLP